MVQARRKICLAPKHPYTQALLSAVPIPDPAAQKQRVMLKGDVPTPINPPAGCRFHTRCPYVFDRCRVEEPMLKEAAPAHLVACHLREPEANGAKSTRADAGLNARPGAATAEGGVASG